MADLTGDPNGTFTNTVRQLETTDPRHPDTWNPEYQKLITNDVLLKGVQDAQQSEIVAARGGEADVDTRLANIEADIDQVELDTATVQKHSDTLDALTKHGEEAVGYDIPEQVESFDVTAAVSGDNSIDLADTTDVIEGQRYFLIEGATIEEVKILDVLSGTRVTATENLANNFTSAAVMKRWDAARLITMEHPGKMAFCFVEGSEDLAVDVEYETGSGWVAVTVETNGGYRAYGPVRFRVTVTTGTLTKVITRGVRVLEDTADTKRYVLEIEDGTLLKREV